MGRGGARLARGGALLVLAMMFGTGAHALPAQSWNGYKWARTGPLAIKLGDNVSAVWKPYLATAATQWSAVDNIDFVQVVGATTPATCGAIYGTVQVCSGNYGATGWLGYTNVWLGAGFISKATIRLNDYYYTQPKYDTAAWRAQGACHEAGHALGLAHTNDVRNNANTGSCMDVTADPSGLLSGYLLANTAPNATDFAALGGIYATLDTTQLSQTRPTMLASHGLAAEGYDDFGSITAVPEPASWALMIAGFGLVGATMRRRAALTA